MHIYGIDFTSRPSRRKPITCLECRFTDGVLIAGRLLSLSTFADFEAVLRRPGPWIAGIDFPFGQPRKLIENLGWPQNWQVYVQHVGEMSRQQFRAKLDEYRASRPLGDKEHRRQTDIAAGSLSPMKLYGTPVGLMFFEGATRLLESGVTIPGLLNGDPNRIVVEAYPGVLARNFIGRRGYKHDAKAKQSAEQKLVRRDLLTKLHSDAHRNRYGFVVDAPNSIADDPSADELDALLCAIQGAWAWTQREQGYGMPPEVEPLEGWIAEPLTSD